MSYELLLLIRQDNVGIIQLNRPEVLNALSQQLYSEIDAAVTELEDDGSVHAIIFTGSGEPGGRGGPAMRFSSSPRARNVFSN